MSDSGVGETSKIEFKLGCQLRCSTAALTGGQRVLLGGSLLSELSYRHSASVHVANPLGGEP